MTQDINVDCSNNIKYEGNVTISVCKDNKVIRNINFKNAGRFPLFQFFVECLLGNYKQAEIKRPLSLMAYSLLNVEDGTSINDIVETYINNNKINELCSYTNKVTFGDITYSSIPEVVINTDKDGYAEITYTFKVPFTHLAIPQGRNISLIAMYGRENRLAIGNPNAYIFITDPNDPSKLGGLLSQEELNNPDNVSYNLLIKWKLKLGNK